MNRWIGPTAPLTRAVAEDLDHQFAEPIDHFRLLREIRCAIHHSQDFDQTNHSVQSAERLADRGQDGKSDASRRGGALFQGQIRTNAARQRLPVAEPGNVTGREEQIPRDYRRNIRCHRFGCRRKFQLQILYPLLEIGKRGTGMRIFFSKAGGSLRQPQS